MPSCTELCFAQDRSGSQWLRVITSLEIYATVLLGRYKISYLLLQMSFQHRKPSRPSSRMKTAKSNEAGLIPPCKDLVCPSDRSIRRRYDTKALHMIDSWGSLQVMFWVPAEQCRYPGGKSKTSWRWCSPCMLISEVVLSPWKQASRFQCKRVWSLRKGAVPSHWWRTFPCCIFFCVKESKSSR